MLRLKYVQLIKHVPLDYNAELNSAKQQQQHNMAVAAANINLGAGSSRKGCSADVPELLTRRTQYLTRNLTSEAFARAI